MINYSVQKFLEIEIRNMFWKERKISNYNKKISYKMFAGFTLGAYWR